MTDFSVDQLAVDDARETFGSQWEDFRDRLERWNPCYEPAYLSLWERARGEPDSCRILAAWDNAGNLAAYAPLMRARGRVGPIPVPTVRFIGNNVGYPGDITHGEVFATAPELPAVKAILRHVSSTWSIGKWELGYVSLSSPTRHAISEILRDGFVDLGPPSAVPFLSVDLPEDYGTYLTRLSKTTRAEFRRRVRLLEGNGTLKVVVEETPRGVRRQLVELLRNHERWCAGTTREGWLGDAAVRAFQVAASEHLAREGHFVAAALELNGSPIAWVVGPACSGTYFAQLTSYDRTYARFSPGVILHLELIRELIARGFRKVDLGPRSSRLKRCMGGVGELRAPVLGYQGWVRPAAWFHARRQRWRAG